MGKRVIVAHTLPYVASCNGARGGKPKCVGVKKNWKKRRWGVEIYPPAYAKRWGIKKIPSSPGPRGPWGKKKKIKNFQEFSGIFRKNQEFSGIFRKYQEKSGKIRKNQEFSGISNTWGTWGWENFFSEKTLGLKNFTLKSSNAVGRSGGDLGNAVGRWGKKILPPSAEHLGVKKPAGHVCQVC